MSTTIEIPAVMLTIAQYAAAVQREPRTITRWLKASELPGATLQGGKWMIPADAVRTTNPGELVPVVSDVVDVAPTPALESVAVDAFGNLPTFFTIEQAAQILSSPGMRISPYRIRKDREYFGVAPVGPNGMLVVPLAAIRKLRGA